jgi:hypothetical protein
MRNIHRPRLVVRSPKGWIDFWLHFIGVEKGSQISLSLPRRSTGGAEREFGEQRLHTSRSLDLDILENAAAWRRAPAGGPDLR